MQTINFHPDGKMDLPPAFFADWIIDNTLTNGMDRLADPSSRTLEWSLRVSAAELAADVAASRSDWSAFSLHLAGASLHVGMEQDEVPAMLADAWNWGRAHPTKWMDLPRRWVFDLEAEEFVDVKTGVTLAVSAFDWAFSDLCPLPGWSIGDFFLCEGPLIEVDRVVTLPVKSAQIIDQDDEAILIVPEHTELN